MDKVCSRWKIFKPFNKIQHGRSQQLGWEDKLASVSVGTCHSITRQNHSFLTQARWPLLAQRLFFSYYSASLWSNEKQNVFVSLTWGAEFLYHVWCWYVNAVLTYDPTSCLVALLLILIGYNGWTLANQKVILWNLAWRASVPNFEKIGQKCLTFEKCKKMQYAGNDHYGVHWSQETGGASFLKFGMFFKSFNK